jgi:hypothetical protein
MQVTQPLRQQFDHAGYCEWQLVTRGDVGIFMEDADAVARVAAEFLARHGPKAIADLHDMAEIAAGNGDRLSAEAWIDIADVAARLLRRH